MVEKGFQQYGGQTEMNIMMRPMVETTIREALDLMNLDFPVNRDELERKLGGGPGRETFVELRVPLREVIRRIDNRNFNSEKELERNIIETLPDVITRHPVLRGVMSGETGWVGGEQRRGEYRGSEYGGTERTFERRHETVGRSQY